MLTTHSDLDALATFETAASLSLPSSAPTRYAVRQVLDQELQRTIALREAQARQARFHAGNPSSSISTAAILAPAIRNVADQENGKTAAVAVKRDFFGRVVEARPLAELDVNAVAESRARKEEKAKVWVTYHEGLNNAVRKPITVQEFLGGL